MTLASWGRKHGRDNCHWRRQWEVGSRWSDRPIQLVLPKVRQVSLAYLRRMMLL